MDLDKVKIGDLITIALDDGTQVTASAYCRSSTEGCWIIRADNGEGRAYFASPGNVVDIKYFE